MPATPGPDHSSVTPKPGPRDMTPELLQAAKALAETDKAAELPASPVNPAGNSKKKKPVDSRAEPEPRALAASPELEFLAKVSHEIRTPLNSIIGFAELMKEERLGPVGNERYKTYIGDIEASGQYALSLINDLLDISRIQAGEFELNFTSVDINEVIGECVRRMQPQAQKERVLLRMSAGDDVPLVLADRRSVTQMLNNLLSNAVKFTGPGGQVIVCSHRKASGAVRLRVIDNGTGMSEEEAERAMRPFQQVDALPRKQVGTGLGLPLTKALARANHAKFKLKSDPASGTKISITFPAKRTVKR